MPSNALTMLSVMSFAVLFSTYEKGNLAVIEMHVRCACAACRTSLLHDANEAVGVGVPIRFIL